MAAHIDQAAWERKCRIRRRVILITVSAIMLAVGIFCLVKFLIVPAVRYSKAEAALDGGDVRTAIDYFGAAGNYRDSVQRAADIAAALQEDSVIVEMLKSAEIGSYVTFGLYEQDNRTGTGLEPIEWMVLRKKDGRVLLFSKYVLFQAKYNEVKEDVTWETCTLRKLLNTVFYEEAFSPAERLLIANTTLQNESNPVTHSTVGGNPTKDRIFILGYNDFMDIARSYDDGLDLFDLGGRPTDYAFRHGVDMNWTYFTSCYWVRTPGETQSSVVYVDMFGTPLHHCRVDAKDYGVRPALWVYVGE